MKEETEVQDHDEAEIQTVEEAVGIPDPEDFSADGAVEKTEEKPSAETGVSPIRAFTETEGVEERSNVSLREILGGDILTGDWLRRQMGLILLCTFFAIIYITNRYSAEQEMIEIERLKVELMEVRYRALTRSGELTVKTRQSQLEKALRATADSVLQTPKKPPFLIKSQNKEE